MRSIGRTLIILLVALVVVGTTAAIQASFADQTSVGGAAQMGQATGDAAATGEVRHGPPAGERGERGEHGGAEGSLLSGAIGIGKNLAIVGVIVALTALVTSLWRRLRPAGGRRAPPPAPAA